jgi:hypothetical protein
MGITLPVGGNLTAAELITIVIGTIVALRPDPTQPKISNSSPLLVYIVVALMIANVNLVASDITSGQNFVSYFKTWVRFLIIPLLIISIKALINHNILNVKYLLVFGIIGLMIAYMSKANYWYSIDAWKYNIAPWLIVGCLSMISPKARFSNTIVLFAFAIINAYFGYRTMVLICAALGFVNIAIVPLSQMPSSKSFRNLVLISILTIVGLVGSNFYNYVAISGALGPNVQGKQISQKNAYGGYFLASRPEFYFSMKSTLKHPLIGQGSNPRDQELAGEYLRQLIDSGQNFAADNYRDRDLIPIHSLMFDAWIKTGIFGGLAWVAILSIVLKYLYQTISDTKYLDISHSFLAFLMVWNIFFSPMSSQLRYYACLTICIASSFTSKKIQKGPVGEFS